MSTGPDAGSGWHVARQDGSGWKGGPFTWEQLLAFVAERRLKPHDLVWHESLPDWQPAESLPGLFAAEAPAPAPQPGAAPQPMPMATPTYAMPPQPSAQPPRKKRGWLVALIATLVVLLLAGGGFAAWRLLGSGGGGLAGNGPDLGAADVKLPDSSSLIVTERWGEVPANQIGVLMAEGTSRRDAERVAESVGGTIVGEVEFIDFYQIEFAGTTEAELIAAIEAAEANDKVTHAHPNEQVFSEEEIWGVRVDPYQDPIYGGGAGDGYRAIGVSRAWAFIKGAGVDLSGVKVGVVDDGLYRPGEGDKNEFKGSVSIEFPDPDAGELAGPKVKNGVANAAGSHGTAVATIIGANPDNGGPAGIAGPLGNKLTISMINHRAGKYGESTTTPDPDDVTKMLWGDGKTYAVGSLVALKKQIEAGAKVINCSWGNSNADPKSVETYKRFFTKMAEQHPDVLFVCSGGNGGKEMDGSKRFPSGLKLDNMITVGALDNDGKKAEYADWASDDYEITLGAPGTEAVVGADANGAAVRQDGSSFAAPHVAAAAAILKSLNPKLTAGQIKAILTSTARTGVPSTSTDPGATSNLIPPEMGGKVLAVDEAVLKVINDLRGEKGLPPFTAEMLEKLGVVDAVAITGGPGEYQVKGIVEAAGEKGVTLKIEVIAENGTVGGETEQALAGAGSAEWAVLLPEDKGVIKVTRLDSGAASVITVEKIDINGAWSGSFTFTSVNVDPETANEQGCAAAMLQELVGTPMPMTMNLTVGEDGSGTGTMFIDIGAVMEDASSEPQDITVTQSGSTVTFGVSEGGDMSAKVARSGDTLTMTGTLTYSGPGFSIVGSYTLSKPAPSP